MSDKIIKVFKKTELFGGLDDKTLRELAAQAVELFVMRDGVLFVAGEEARGLYVVAEGSIRGFRTAIDGREQIIFIEHAPATIAEVPVFDGGTYFSTAAAEVESKLYFIEKDFILALCAKQPDFALKAIKLLARRVRNFAQLIEELSLHDVRVRLVHFLLLEARRRGESQGDEIRLNLDLTRTQIAARIGTVREVVSRNLKQLEIKNLIRFENKWLIIPNEAALTNYSNKE